MNGQVSWGRNEWLFQLSAIPPRLLLVRNCVSGMALRHLLAFHVSFFDTKSVPVHAFSFLRGHSLPGRRNLRTNPHMVGFRHRILAAVFSASRIEQIVDGSRPSKRIAYDSFRRCPSHDRFQNRRSGKSPQSCWWRLWCVPPSHSRNHRTNSWFCQFVGENTLCLCLRPCYFRCVDRWVAGIVSTELYVFPSGVEIGLEGRLAFWLT